MYIKHLGIDTKKFIPSIAVLVFLGVGIWLGVNLFSGKFQSLLGSILFLICLVAFIVSANYLNKHKRRKPSFKLVIFALLVIFFVLAFAGVQPFNEYKDSGQNWVVGIFEGMSAGGAGIGGPSPIVTPEGYIPTPEPVKFTAPAPVPPLEPAPVTVNPASPEDVYPRIISISGDVKRREDLGLFIDVVNVTVELRCTPEVKPGHYTVSLVSDGENFGTELVDWYRGDGVISNTWRVEAGTSAFRQLKDNADYSSVFDVDIGYTAFHSTTPGLSNPPNHLDQEIFVAINNVRGKNSQAPVVWSDGLYNLAGDYVLVVGEEGELMPSGFEHPYYDVCFEASKSIDAMDIVNQWRGNSEYREIIESNRITGVAVKTDTYSNGRFYAVAIFMIE